MVEKKSDKKNKSKSRKRKNSSKIYFSYIDYKDVSTLRKFINRQGRINHRQNTQLVAKTQRQLTKAIKRARQMALLLYTIVDQTEEIQK